MSEILNNAFDLQQVVYLKTDGEQHPRIVTAIIKRPGMILYELSSGTVSTCHYDFEISVSVDVMRTTTN